jgi:hypothetical protein
MHDGKKKWENIVVGKPQGRSTLETWTYRLWEDIIKMELREVRCKEVYLLDLACAVTYLTSSASIIWCFLTTCMHLNCLKKSSEV